MHSAGNYSAKETQKVITVCSVGAVVGLGVNLLITSGLGAVGSSISWGLSEIAVLCAGLVLVKRTLSIRLDFRLFLVEAAKSLVYAATLLLVFFAVGDGWWRLGIGAVAVAVEFVLMNLVFCRNELMVEVLDGVVGKFRRV